MASRRKKISLIIAGLVAVTAACLALVNLHARWQLKSLRNELLAKGEKLSVAELVPPAVPAESNSAAELIKAGVTLEDLAEQYQAPLIMELTGPGTATVMSRGVWQQRVEEGVVQTNTWESLNADLEARRTALEKFRTALELPGFQRPLVNEYFADTRSSERRLIFAGGKVLALEALRQLSAKNHPAAAGTIVSMLTLVRAWEPEAVPVSQLIRQQISTWAYGLTWELLQAERLSETDLAALQDAWQQVRFLTPLIRSVEMDQAVALEEYPRLRASPKKVRGLFGVAINPVLPTSLTERGQRFLQQANEGLRAFMREDLWRWHWSYGDEHYFLKMQQMSLEALRAIQSHKSLARFQEVTSGLGEEVRWQARTQRYLISFRTYIPPHSFAERALRAETQRSMALTALALRRYEKQNGRPARQLEDLVPALLSELPRDWMDGKTLRWAPDAPAGRRLYSAGMNGTDDGGNPEKMAGKKNYENGWDGLDYVWPVAVPAGNSGR